MSLIRKLLAEGHLNVSEREPFAGEGIPLSTILEAAEQILENKGRLPPSWSEEDDFEGALLKKAADGYRLLECHEIGVGRYGEKRSREFRELSAAVRRWLRVQHGEKIDGLKIRWED